MLIKSAILLTLSIAFAEGQDWRNNASLPSGNYSATTNVDSQSLSHLFFMAKQFVDIVFPSLDDINSYVQEVLKSPDYLQYITSNWQKLLNLEAGFLACVVFGILFIVLVPVVGLFMCCCRTSCKGCGGHMIQSESRSKSCWRTCLCMGLLVLSVSMTIPIVFVFLTNGWITSVLSVAPSNVQTITGNGIEYIDTINDQFDYVVGQYNSLDTTLRNKIKDFGTDAGGLALVTAKHMSDPAFRQFDDVVKSMESLISNLTSTESSATSLISGINDLKSRLKNQSIKMEQGLSTCSIIGPGSDAYCHSVYVSTSTLTIDADTTSLEDLQSKAESVNKDMSDVNLSGLRSEANSTLYGISDTVKNETQKLMDDANNELTKANNSFQSITTQIPKDQLITFKTTLHNASNNVAVYINAYSTGFDKHRYMAGIVLAVILLSIVCSYYVGITMGSCGHSSHEPPDERSALSNCGGIMLMVGVGLSFIFSWLFMILVLVTFTIGGHVERYACQTFVPPYKGLKVLEDNLKFVVTAQLGISNSSIISVLDDCNKDKSLYHVLNLGSKFNIDKLTNDIKAQLDFQKFLNGSSFGLNFNLYNDDVKQKLDRVDTSEFNISAYDIPSTNFNLSLLDYANFLNESADNYTTSLALAPLTRSYSAEVLMIHENYVKPLQTHIDQLLANRDHVIDIQTKLNASIALLKSELQSLDAKINNNASELVKAVVTPIIDDITNDVVSFIDWIVVKIKDEFGKCKPLSDVYNQSISLLCDYAVDTMNGLWFSLGWCVFLLIPSAIVAMKLAKFYRIVRNSDKEFSYMNDLEMEAHFKQ